MTGTGFQLTLPVGAAMIIGGTGALGRAIASAFARAGSDIAFTHRRQGPQVDAAVADVAAHGGRVETVGCDLREPGSAAAAIEYAFNKFGHIHSLIYAAGPDIAVRFLSELQADVWKETFDADVHGFFAGVKAAIPIMRRGGGTITAVTTAATRRYPPKDVLSAAPKAAIETVVRAIAREEGRYGIRANAVAPGWIGSGLGARIIDAEHGGNADKLAAAIPLRRLGDADEVAAAVLFLSSQQAAYVSGQVLAVDGGWQV
ncbi:SDR family oxidoreductase [Aquibium sp. LZ166]|uniref:SDR family oxidoreductase n=1 Tax=Aquibium pacificus TaxID=3153579 RepID=A0ABV3SP15_9HYPH